MTSKPTLRGMANVSFWAEDLKVARTYAAAYERAKGPQVALVKKWIEYLDPPPTTRRR